MCPRHFLFKNKMTSVGLKINRITELHLSHLNPFGASDPFSVNELNPEGTGAPGSLLLPPFLCLSSHHPQAGLALQFECMGELFLLLENSQSLIACPSGTGYRNILRPHPPPSCWAMMLICPTTGWASALRKHALQFSPHTFLSAPPFSLADLHKVSASHAP